MIQFNQDGTETSIISKAAISGGYENKGKVDYNKSNFVSDLKASIEKEFNKESISFKSIDFVKDEKSTTGMWGFTFKFTFSDEDYDLTDAQKNGIDYRIDVQIGDADNPITGTWVEWI